MYRFEELGTLALIYCFAIPSQEVNLDVAQGVEIVTPNEEGVPQNGISFEDAALLGNKKK